MTHEIFVTKKKATYISKKDGQEKKCYNFFLCIDDNIRIAIKPTFQQGYTLLSAFSLEEMDDSNISK